MRWSGTTAAEREDKWTAAVTQSVCRVTSHLTTLLLRQCRTETADFVFSVRGKKRKKKTNKEENGQHEKKSGLNANMTELWLCSVLDIAVS